MPRASTSTRPFRALLVVLVVAGLGVVVGTVRSTGAGTATPRLASSSRTVTSAEALPLLPSPSPAPTPVTTTTAAAGPEAPESHRDAPTWVRPESSSSTGFRVELHLDGRRIDVWRDGRLVRSVNVSMRVDDLDYLRQLPPTTPVEVIDD